MFIETLFENPQFFWMVVLTVVISITLHELAHGFAAMRLGDDTPLRTGHITGNPFIHMGPFSLLALALAGIAWGSMPIDPSRLRGKYAEAKVAFAGPAVNLNLSLLALTALGLWQRFDPVVASEVAMRGRMFLMVFGMTNLALFVFNLLPVPPLDGSRILANFSRPYADWVGNPANQGAVFILFPVAFILSSRLFDATNWLCLQYIQLIRGG